MRFYPPEKNVGGWDRLLRLIVGPILLIGSAAAILGVIVLSPILVALGVIVGATLTVTGLTQKCPLNNLLGLNTYKSRRTAESETEQENIERPA
ncbi:hypothetical protein HAPAU_30860 [Halalkalicoccus paucihalophilus]|uniref:Inner membrane protein YgaP-like transmembrane domain-containing protein n=1 Tax=Halalkalicoccus paucihalophilus TaxID=1008153 RepID=A0A151AAY5_9EURY|nr:DUF2892 domain-containing protein [Halalkalicoccus paucihalophilus]KYH24710.1 hypothetical protein HAPAU_30860 [Halalkalicoccus paucihalophilus]